jgi:hypothetical protein
MSIAETRNIKNGHSEECNILQIWRNKKNIDMTKQCWTRYHLINYLQICTNNFSDVLLLNGWAKSQCFRDTATV